MLFGHPKMDTHRLGDTERRLVNAVGSDYEWVPRCGTRVFRLPAARVFYLLGRHAIAAAAKECLGFGGRLWLPQYFCSHTCSAIAGAGIRTAVYVDNPLRAEPDWNTLQASPGDAVLFVNFFGVRGQVAVAAWQEKHSHVAAIEDHSHDPFSTWAHQSRAAFAIASLRKTIPIPDGGVLWSPATRRLPSKPGTGAWTGSGLKLAAMIYKRDYLTAAVEDEELFQALRRLQTTGDEAQSSEPMSTISPWSLEYVCRGVSVTLRNRRQENVRLFVEHAKGLSFSSFGCRLGYTSWPEGHCPFNPLLVFRDEYTRNLCRDHLVENRVYAPIHWPNQPGIPAPDGGTQYLLTIPLDFRCTADDVHRVLNVLAAFVSKLD